MNHDSFRWILIQEYWDAYGTITENNETFFDENGCLKKINSKYSQENKNDKEAKNRSCSETYRGAKKTYLGVD